MMISPDEIYKESRKRTAGIGTNRRYCKRCQEYKYTDKPNDIMLKCPDCNYRIRNKPHTKKKKKRNRRLL